MRVHLLALIVVFVPLYTAAESASLYTANSSGADNRTSIVLLYPSGVALNVVAGDFALPSDARNVRVDTSHSVVWVWVSKPEVVSSRAHFEALLPGGFTGVALPGSGLAGAGELFRVTYEASDYGAVESGYAFAHDGLGTPVPLVVAAPVSGARVVKEVDSEPPTIIFADIIRDSLLREGAPTLVVHATDRGTGVDRIEMRSGAEGWVTVETGHPLSDELVSAGISIRVFDRDGNYRELTIANPVPEVPYALLSGVAVVFLLLVYFIRWRGSLHSLRSQQS